MAQHALAFLDGLDGDGKRVCCPMLRAHHILQILSDNRVPGAAFVHIRDGEIADEGFHGLADAHRPVASDTAFQAASLSKPAFAHAILQLIDAGQLSLDQRLAEIMPTYVPDDPRAADVTVAHVLSHTTGLPNWRSDELPLRTYFPPGSRFSYSGEGFVWLQIVAKRVSGLKLEELARKRVFDPLGMQSSTFDPARANPEVLASPHDGEGAPFATPLPPAQNAAASLHTTVGDYAKFVQAALARWNLSSDSAARWMTPLSFPPFPIQEAVKPDGTAPPGSTLAWGLGWGLEDSGRTFFHWGDTPGFRTFVLGSVADRAAVIVLTNGERGGKVAAEIAHASFPGEHESLRWLGWA